MKVLCPTDFSYTSINACKWIVKYLDQMGGGTVKLVHCINIQRRAGLYTSMNDTLREKAEMDIKQLKAELRKISDKVAFKHSISHADPKSGALYLTQNGHFDLVVVGTKGLTALKNLTVGSVTEYLINHSPIPVLAIPNNIDYFRLKSVVIGVDSKVVSDMDTVKPLIDLVKFTGARLDMVHVRQKGDPIIEYDPGMDIYFSDLDYRYKSLELDDTVAETLTEYADDIDADMLVMIHRKRNWLERLFKKSHTKQELFEIETPLLVLQSE